MEASLDGFSTLASAYTQSSRVGCKAPARRPCGDQHHRDASPVVLWACLWLVWILPVIGVVSVIVVGVLWVRLLFFVLVIVS
jgi:hypothetical protein